MQDKAQAQERQFKCDLYSPSFCASPNHLLIRLDIVTFIKTAPESLTIAFASMLFPVLGGPYNNTPFCGPRSFPCEELRFPQRKNYQFIQSLLDRFQSSN